MKKPPGCLCNQVAKFMSFLTEKGLTVNLLHVCDELENLVRVTDLVVVP